MKLYITDKGDWTVGIPQETFEIDCPFNEGDLPDEDVQIFKEDMIKLYSPFIDRMDAFYENEQDFEE